MALAMSGMQRIAGKLSVRRRLLAVAMAIAALSLLILSPAWIFYKAYNASMQEQLVFALAVIFAALAAGLVGFALAELLLRATFQKKAEDRTAALSTGNEQLKE